MIVFHTDLDRTLIYSHRAQIGEDKHCVEFYQGREVSFMTSRSCSLIREIAEQEEVLIVPTTTRSIEQYQRISLPVEPEYALVCNGGVLLRKGIKDRIWYEESLRRIAPAGEEMEKAKKLMEEDVSRSFELRFLEELFLFTKSSDPIGMKERLAEKLDLNKVSLFTNKEKVYVLPEGLDKGEALRRFREYLQERYPKKSFQSIGAGDSSFDIPMLAQSDIAFAPAALAKESGLSPETCLFSEEEIFSDRLLEELAKLL